MFRFATFEKKKDVQKTGGSFSLDFTIKIYENLSITVKSWFRKLKRGRIKQFKDESNEYFSEKMVRDKSAQRVKLFVISFV